MLNFSSAWRCSSAFSLFTLSPPRSCSIACSMLSLVAWFSAQCPRALSSRLQDREREELAGDELIVALRGELVAKVQTTAEVIADRHVAGVALHGGNAVQHLAEPRAQAGHVDIPRG